MTNLEIVMQKIISLPPWELSELWCSLYNYDSRRFPVVCMCDCCRAAHGGACPDNKGKGRICEAYAAEWLKAEAIPRIMT